MSRLRNSISRFIALGVVVCALGTMHLLPYGIKTSCCCSAPETSAAQPASCCSKVEEKSCCSAPLQKSCCCKPVTKDCNCLGCQCGETEDRGPDQPIAPVEQLELVYIGHLGVDAGISSPWPSERQSTWPSTSTCCWPKTALETCVLLSRFTC